MDDVKFTLYLTLALVVMVIFLFLRNVSATIIPSLALPMSIVGTFSVMYLLGYTVDNLSLMALVLAVGFVVDDAIVMLENIVRHLEMGEGVMEASLNGSKEISFTILSMTLSLAAVFIPVLFMGGILGRLLHEFSVTIMSRGAGIGRGLAHADAHAVQPLPAPRQAGGARLPVHAVRARLRRLLKAYDWSLRKVLRFRFVTFVLSLVIVGSRVWLFIRMPKGFLPSEDSGFIFGVTMAQQGISFDSMKEHQKAIDRIIDDDPNVQNTMSFAGAGGPGGRRQSGFFFLNLKPRPSGRTQMVEWFKDRLHIAYPRDPELSLRGYRPGLAGTAPPAFPGSRHHGLHAEPAPHPDRRLPDQEPVPVHPAGA